MLVIRVELHDANTGKASLLGRMAIVNDGTGDTELGNYDVVIANDSRKPVVIGRITRWPRSRTVWRLVLAALLKAYPGDREPPCE